MGVQRHVCEVVIIPSLICLGLQVAMVLAQIAERPAELSLLRPFGYRQLGGSFAIDSAASSCCTRLAQLWPS